MKVKDVQNKLLELQKEYGIGLVAVTYIGTCSCCAEPEDFPAEWFFNSEIPESWNEVGSRIIFKNAHNGSGELNLNDEYEQEIQFVGYGNVGRETLVNFLKGVVEYLNTDTDNKYQLKVPEDTDFCAEIFRDNN